MAKRLITLAGMALGLALSPTSADAQQPSTAPTAQRDGQKDFDWETGTWTTKVRVRRNRQLRRDRANLTPRDELQHAGLRNPGRLRDVACGVDVLRNGTGTKHGCACVTSKALPRQHP